MKIGLQFESVLKRGLLEFAVDPAERVAGVPLRLPRGHRGGAALADVPGVRQPQRLRRGRAACRRPDRQPRVIVRLGRALPPAVLRVRARRRGPDRLRAAPRAAVGPGRLHPLLERIMRIHVTEEARHLSFARHYLKRTVPGAAPAPPRPARPSRAPVILGTMAQMMLRPSRQLVARYSDPPGGHRRGVYAEPAPPGRHRRLAGQGQEAVRRARAHPGYRTGCCGGGCGSTRGRGRDTWLVRYSGRREAAATVSVRGRSPSPAAGSRRGRSRRRRARPGRC